MKHVDVVIIGGSLAGAACVRELARRGVDAVAFERDRFPREKVCGGFLSPGAVDLLRELDVLDAVQSAGAMPVRKSRVRLSGREVMVGLPRPGLGVSRRVLDAVMADHPSIQHGAVRDVRRDGDRFRVSLDSQELTSRVVIDAAGKLSRFTQRRSAPQFGVQFYEERSREDVLDFWFFKEGYGGAVSVEGGRSNACFLINKDAVASFAADCTDYADLTMNPRNPCNPRLITGPVAYDRLPSDYIAIGDAAGMVDPFCGEGMRHALDTGIRAAAIVADGFARGRAYDSMRQQYESDTAQRWNGKRRLGRLIRSAMRYPRLMTAGFRFQPEYWFRKLWD